MTHDGVLMDPGLCKSQAGRDNCCEIISAILQHVQEAAFHRIPSYPPALRFFAQPFQQMFPNPDMDSVDAPFMPKHPTVIQSCSLSSYPSLN